MRPLCVGAGAAAGGAGACGSTSGRAFSFGAGGSADFAAAVSARLVSTARTVEALDSGGLTIGLGAGGAGMPGRGTDASALFQPLNDVGQRHQPAQVDPPEERQLEMIARLRRAADVVVGLRQHVEGAHQILAREEARERADPLALALGGDLGILEARGVEPDEQQVAVQPRQLADDVPHVVAGLDSARGELEHGRPVLARDGLRDIHQQIAPDEAQHGRHVVGRNGRPRECDDLIERALRVAHAAVAGARQERQRPVVYANLLGVGDGLELVGDLLDADGLELEHLRPRLDGRRHFLELRRGHHEDDMRRRLLDRLEERIEGLGRETVDFVDDENLVAVADRRDAQAGDDDVANLVDLCVGGGVDLEHVHVTALSNLDARVAHAARIGRGSLDAVQPARQDAGGRGLPDTARAGEDKRLRDALGGDRVAQRLRDAALADDVIEPLRAPLAGNNLEGGHRRKFEV